jgi:spore maturation protein CgeB
VSHDPVFGRELYQALSRARVVLNGAIDMAGEDRGNMRCWEAMGCGAAMVSDRGRYPLGMVEGQSMLTYRQAPEAVQQIEALLDDPARLSALARAGNKMIRSRYSKAQQWQDFQKLVASL